MSTGYTHYIGSSENPTFKEFAMLCAHAFCIQAKEIRLSDPIPDLEVSDFYLNELAGAQKKLDEIISMSDEEAERVLTNEYNEQVDRYLDYNRKNDALKNKYLEMLTHVNSWSVPTENHVNFKKFMISQIEGSIKWDCHDYSEELKKMTKPTVSEWRHDQISKLNRNIKRYADEYATEVFRVDQGNKWLRDLKESLV